MLNKKGLVTLTENQQAGDQIKKKIKKEWLSYETRLIFVLGVVFEHWCRYSAIFKMELFATIGNDKKLQRASSSM